MADKKISELNTALTVYDADDFALVQDAETKQVNASTVKAYVKDGLSKSDVGLGNVDNTSDANKPVSTATQTALDGKEDADATILKDADIGVSVQAYDADLTAWSGKTAPTGDAVGTSDSQTLTNKTISGSSNTLSNIGNSSLTNSSITINGNAVSLGGSTTVTAATTNTLTIGTGLSGTSFDGSSATTIAIDSSVVTLTGTQTLTNKTLTSPTISGGTANNVAIGGTTPAAGAFTTLSSTGNTTLGDASGDTLTINGTAVSCPNNLNFDSNTLFIDAANNRLGIGTSSPGYLLDASNSQNAQTAARVINSNAGASAEATFIASNGTYLGSFGIAGASKSAFGSLLASDAYVFSNANVANTGIMLMANGTNGVIKFASGGSSEVSRFTSKGLLVGYTSDSGLSGTGNAIFSGSVGIGTSSPASYNSAADNLVLGGSGDNGLSIVSGSSSQGSLFFADGTSGGAQQAAGYLIYVHTSDYMAFGTANTERMRLDASGNLGLGVTPSAWGVNRTAFQFGAVGFLRGDVSASEIGANAYYNGTNWIYTTTAAASRFNQSGGQHTWYTAPSGTAGNAIVFNTAMTLDASGRLLIGATTNALGTRLSVGNGSTAVWALGPQTTTNDTFYVVRQTDNVGVYLGWGSNAWAANSDERVKTALTPITDAARKVSTLRAVTGRYKTDESIISRAFLIAQDVKEVLPQAVDSTNPEKLGVRYTDTIPLLVAAIKELTFRLEILEAKVN